MTDLAGLLRTLVDGGVEFIVVGGLAATAHGSSRLTDDIDVVYRRTPENLHKIAAVLGPLAPYLRGAPPGLPFHLDDAALARGLNFTLTTTAGNLDLLGEIVGGGAFEDLVAHSVEAQFFGRRCLCLGVTALIRAKRAAGRPKDLETAAELEMLLEERDGEG